MDNKKPTTKRPATKPYVDTVREGAIAANIFVSQSADGNQFHYYTLSRCWKNQTSGEFKYTDRMYPRNAKAIAQVSAKAAVRCEELDRSIDQDSSPQAVKAA